VAKTEPARVGHGIHRALATVDRRRGRIDLKRLRTATAGERLELITRALLSREAVPIYIPRGFNARIQARQSGGRAAECTVGHLECALERRSSKANTTSGADGQGNQPAGARGKS